MLGGVFLGELLNFPSHNSVNFSNSSNIYIHDGAIGSLSNCNAKVRVISESPSAILHLSNVLWKTAARAVSHDCCPLTVYVASSRSKVLWVLLVSELKEIVVL